MDALIYIEPEKGMVKHGTVKTHQIATTPPPYDIRNDNKLENMFTYSSKYKTVTYFNPKIASGPR